MAAPVNLIGFGAHLAELWLLRGHPCPACSCPACPAQTCSLTCSGPATSHSEPCEAPEAPAGPGWLSVWLAAAAGAGLAWLAAHRWPQSAKPAAAPSEGAPPALAQAAPAPPPAVGTGPVTPSQLALRA